MWSSVKFWLVACSTLLGALSACSSDKSRAGILDLHDIFGETASQQASYQIRLREAILSELIDCMRRKGFWVNDQNGPSAVEELMHRMEEYTDDRLFASNFGYGITDIAVAAIQDLPNSPITRARTRLEGVAQDIFDRTLNGFAKNDGCLGKAESQALGGVLQLELIRIDLEEMIEQDIRHQNIESQFISCMNTFGLKATYLDWGRDQVFSQVLELQILAKLSLDDGAVVSFLDAEPGTIPISIELPPDILREVRAYELLVAQAEFECRKQIEYQYHYLRSTYEKEFLDENAELVKKIVKAIAG